MACFTLPNSLNCFLNGKLFCSCDRVSSYAHMRKLLLIAALTILNIIAGFFVKQKYDSPKDMQAASFFEDKPIGATNDSLYFSPDYFTMLRSHILQTGRVERVNASSRADKPVFVENHILSFEDWELTADGTGRIYFSKKEPVYKHFGNVLLEGHKVKLECDNSADASAVYAAYNAVIKLIEPD